MKTLNFLLAFFVVLLLVSAIRFLMEEDERRRIVSLISISLAFVGISFTILDKHFSQYGYNWHTIAEYNKIRKTGFDIDKIVNEEKCIPPEYIFCLDVSGSTNNPAKMPGFMRDTVTRFLEENQSCFSDNKKCNELIKRIREGDTYYDLLKLRLLYSMVKLKDIKEDSSSFRKMNFSIICFSDACSYAYRNLAYDSESDLTKKICKSFESINNIRNEGANTDFVSLFRFIDSTSLRNVGNRNVFGHKELVITIFTDYLQDAKWKFDKSKLESILDTINRKNVNLTLYVSSDEKLIASYLKKQKSRRMRYVCPIFDSVLSDFSFQKIDLAENAFLIDYPVTSPKPLPIYHKNTIYEDSLHTRLIINSDDSIRVKVWNHIEEDRRTYDLIIKNRTTSCRLSKNSQTIKVNSDDPIDFNICGYIPSQYTKLPDLVIDDKSRRVRYTIPLAFFMEPPFTVTILLAIAILLLVIPLICRIFRWMRDLRRSGGNGGFSITIARSWNPTIE